MKHILASFITFLLGANAMAASDNTPATTEKAIFAGGCFWCMQPGFDNLDGVIDTVVGYSGGSKEDAHYEAVSSGTTEHFEAIEVTFDPAKVSYEKVIEVYWDNIDPLDAGGQFADRGRHYMTVIFYASEAQKAVAEKTKAAVAKKFAPEKIATQILPAKPFYPAEDYHQDYYKKNGIRYNMYKYGSGRVDKLKQLWGENGRDE